MQKQLAQAGGEQIGTIVLGQRTIGVRYTEDDFDLLEDCADTVVSVVHTVHLQEQSVQQIDTLLKEFRQREQELQSRMRKALAAETGPPVLGGRVVLENRPQSLPAHP